MHIERMHKAMETLSEWLLCECSKGMECFDVCAAGQVSDMLKDLAEASKECEEKKYYEELCKMLKKEAEQMEKMEKEGGERMGYDNWRYSSSGRFAPTGHGTRSGYPIPQIHGNMRFYEQPFDDPGMMGYSGGQGGNRGGSSGNSGSGNSNGGNYGYDDGNSGYSGGNRGGNSGGSQSGSRMGYPMDGNDNYPSKYGAGYDSYLKAKRHYTQSKNESDKHKMNEKIDETVLDSVDVMREMYRDANPETKQRMKQQIEKLSKEMMM